MLTLLALVVPGGCKPRPLVCEAQGVFRIAPAAAQPDGGLLEEARQIGPKVELAHVLTYPIYLSFRESARVRVEWLSFGHVATYTEALYSPVENVARDVDDPREELPLRRFSKGSSERVWLGFHTPLCTDPEALAGRALCREYGPEVPLIADMACQR